MESHAHPLAIVYVFLDLSCPATVLTTQWLIQKWHMLLAADGQIVLNMSSTSGCSGEQHSGMLSCFCHVMFFGEGPSGAIRSGEI